MSAIWAQFTDDIISSSYIILKDYYSPHLDYEEKTLIPKWTVTVYKVSSQIFFELICVSECSSYINRSDLGYINHFFLSEKWRETKTRLWVILRRRFTKMIFKELQPLASYITALTITFNMLVLNKYMKYKHYFWLAFKSKV